MTNSVWLVFYLFIGHSVAWLMEPCNFYPRGFLQHNETEEVIPPPSCQKGVIDWNYPRGSLRIIFTQQEPFKLCVKNWIGGDLLSIFDHSFDQETPLQTLSSDDQCISSNDRTAVLDVKSPSFQTYMAGFFFEINS